MDRKKELKQQYKQMKSDMGIIVIRCKLNNKCHLETSQNLKGTINRTVFSLDFGNYPIRELQSQWNIFGKNNFSVEILEKLEYDKDESKTDYSEDLALLKMIWEEKLEKENIEFYEK